MIATSGNIDLYERLCSASFSWCACCAIFLTQPFQNT